MSHSFFKTLKKYLFWFFISFLAVLTIFLGFLVGIVFYLKGINLFPISWTIGAGLIDGINPCAIGVMLLLLGYLLVFLEKKEAALKLGIIYIITVYFTYLIIGLFFAKFVHSLASSPFSIYFQKAIGLLLLIVGLLNIKDFFFENKGPSLQIPKKSWKYISSLVEKTSVPATVLLAILVTFLETPCSFPIYMGAISLLELSFKKAVFILSFLLIYNLMFVLPLFLILYLVYFANKLVVLKEFQHTGRRWIKLISGIVILVFGIFVLLLK